MTRAQLDRAVLLYQQRRFEAAEQLLQSALAEDPQNAFASAYLALCLAQREAWPEATAAAHRAIHCAPDAPLGHYTLAVVLHDRRRYDEALPPIEEAIRLDPTHAGYCGLLALIEFSRRRWDRALAAAERGLALNPEDEQCTNLRSAALVKLGRASEAVSAIAGSLARNPDSGESHANMGWSLLEQRQPRAALEHFREALRLDPEDGWARSGLLQALKARNPIYALFLRYMLAMSKLGRQAQWGIILGGYVGFQFLRRLERQHPELADWTWPVTLAYVLFAWSTWVAQPLFNLLLRLDRFGRLVLNREEILQANLVGLCLLGAVASFGVAAFTGSAAAIQATVVTLLIVMPLATIFHCDRGWPRRAMTGYTLGLLGVGAAAVAAYAGRWPQASGLQMLFLVGAIASGFVANGLAGVTVRK